MRFEWDDEKNELNQKKHGVAFEVASGVFADPNVLEYIERVIDGEERWHAIGFASGTVLFLTVVHTHLGETWCGSSPPAKPRTAKGNSMLVQFSADELFNRPFSDLQKQQILALMDRPASEIDTSDIPEITELPPGTVRGRFYRGPTVRLNEELRQYFAERSSREGVPFNDLVIETLSKAVASSQDRPCSKAGQ